MASRKPATRAKSQPKLLSGGNPQIAKGDGEGPVRAYLAALPGWKRRVGVQLDRVITAAVPGVAKAVRWNSPFYGMPGEGWFAAFHCMQGYVKLGFFCGAQLVPLPPVASKQAKVRYLHVSETDDLDEAQLREWVQQAARLPGERLF